MKTVLLNTIDSQQVQYDPKLGGLDHWEEIPCLRCGACCTKWQAPCSRKEMSLIAESIGISLTTFIRRYTRKYPYKRGEFLLNHNGKGCVFLSYENGIAACKIYEIRPAACRNWVPSFSHPECRTGLRKPGDQLLLPGELYPEGSELNDFLTCLRIKK